MIDTEVVSAISPTLSDRLLSRLNPDGGWSYYAGRASRIEPTCWAVLALDPAASAKGRPGAFLGQCQRPDGWLVEQPQWPVNTAFNALAAFTWIVRRDIADDTMRRRLLDALIAEKGRQIPQSPIYGQDNSLQAWSWMSATFSWVEPTAWGLLALKKATRDGSFSNASSRSRIDEAERLLLDRVCKTEGGWNFGNPNILGTDLLPHVPTTALALLALQDRRDQPSVSRSLKFLEERWSEEQSAPAMGLSAICLRVYGHPAGPLQERLAAHMAAAKDTTPAKPSNSRRIDASSNVHGMAIALTALAEHGHELFKI